MPFRFPRGIEAVEVLSVVQAVVYPQVDCEFLRVAECDVGYGAATSRVEVSPEYGAKSRRHPKPKKEQSVRVSLRFEA